MSHFVGSFAETGTRSRDTGKCSNDVRPSFGTMSDNLSRYRADAPSDVTILQQFNLKSGFVALSRCRITVADFESRFAV